ncbi:S1 family peptidase [Actinoplanes sp. NPDC051513]|uniref:S1 family peptidase n=1 Tax=Actinoplanes sp. NPDC051513 TaxID=3363908 RepID=UPI00378FBEAC
MVRKAALILIGVIVSVAAMPSAHATVAPRPVREVVGGDVAPLGKFPWMVRLSMGCGGTLTAPRVVLTAGHCVDGTGKTKNIKVTAGVVDLKSPKALTARSVSVIRAPGFRDETRGDDWALVRLDRALDLPTLPLIEGPGDQGEFVVLGWGQTREDSMKQEQRLHYATVPTVPDAKCAAEYQKAGVKLVAKESICAGKRGVDTCQGDSGGPMVGRDAKGEWAQVGIVSWGLGCARIGYPGVYTQISAFRDEIRKAIKKLN